MVDKVDLKIVFELLKEVREDQKEHGKELAKQSADLQNLKSDVSELKANVSKNTADVAHHIKRTDLLEAINESNQKKVEDSLVRLEKLEEPVKAKEWIKKHVIALSAIITAMASIAAFLIEKFGK